MSIEDRLEAFLAGQEPIDAAPGELRPLLEAARRLRPVKRPGLPGERWEEGRTAFLAEAAQRRAARRAGGLRLPRLAFALAGLVAALMAGGTAYAAQGSLPGDPLYPVKRWTERAWARVAFADAGAGHAWQGRRRVEEIDRLEGRGRAPAEPLTVELDGVEAGAVRIGERSVPLAPGVELPPGLFDGPVELRLGLGPDGRLQVVGIELPEPAPAPQPPVEATPLAPTPTVLPAEGPLGRPTPAPPTPPPLPTGPPLPSPGLPGLATPSVPGFPLPAGLTAPSFRVPSFPTPTPAP